MKVTHKKEVCIIASIAIGFAAILAADLSVSADQKKISSTGNFVFGNNEAAFYAEDIEYLQNEITLLFNEIEE